MVRAYLEAFPKPESWESLCTVAFLRTSVEMPITHACMLGLYPQNWYLIAWRGTGRRPRQFSICPPKMRI